MRTRIARLVRAGSFSFRSGLAEATMVGLSVAVVVLGAPALPAGAGTIASAKSQLQALQAEVQSGAARIASLTLAYEQADTRATSLAEQVTADRSEVATLQRELAATSTTLRNDAIYSYMGGDMTTDSGPVSAESSAIGEEYLTLASGDLEDASDRYRTDESEASSAEAQLAAEVKASDAALASTAAARGDALQEAASVQSQVTGLERRLSSLEAQAAAAAANAPQGLPVNNGLVTVVQSVVGPASGGNAGGVWLRLRECESGDNYQENTGNGFYGAYQFSQQTWTGLGFPGRPDLEPPAMQDQAAQELQQRSGWGQWPACAAALGLT